MKRFLLMLSFCLCFLSFFAQNDIRVASQVKVATWNVEWLSCEENGPSDEDKQMNNVATVIKGLDLDIVALEEVGTSSSYRTIDTLVKRLGSGWAGKIYASTEENCWQNQGVIWKTSRASFVNGQLLANNAGSSYNWSSGRWPVLYNMNILADGTQIPVSFVVIHAKAYKDVDSYTRRKNASTSLKTLLDGSSYNSKKLMVIGDFNDYLNGTQCLDYSDSPYKNFMDDATNYKGITSGIYHNIDNIVISNELFNNYVANSAKKETTAQNLVSDFSTTTSDHLPVSAVFSFFNESAVEDLIEDNRIAIYPNPVETELNVQCAMCNVQCVEIFDITGKLHSALHFDYSTKKINVVDLNPGIYFLKIDNNIIKFVKE